MGSNRKTVTGRDRELFDFLDNLFMKFERVNFTTIVPELFVVGKFLASHPKGFPLARLCSFWMGKVPAWVVACMLFHVAPKLRAAPRMYYAKDKIVKDGDGELVGAIARALNYSDAGARQILSLLGRQGVSVKEIFGRE